MSLAAEADQTLDELRAHQEALVAELRDVDHWRRLVEARLDLAVAAVTNIDELALRRLPPMGPPPCRLHALLGIPSGADALSETSVLVRLRETSRVLGEYASELQVCLRGVSQHIAERLVHEADFGFVVGRLSDRSGAATSGVASGTGPMAVTNAISTEGSVVETALVSATGTEDNVGTGVGFETGVPEAAADDSRGTLPRSSVVWLPVPGGSDKGSV